MAVDRCICTDVSFRDLIDRARRDGLTFEQLRERTGCAAGCALCEPYVRLALRTGRDQFDVLSPEAIAQAMKDQT